MMVYEQSSSCMSTITVERGSSAAGSNIFHDREKELQIRDRVPFKTLLFGVLNGRHAKESSVVNIFCAVRDVWRA